MGGILEQRSRICCTRIQRGPQTYPSLRRLHPLKKFESPFLIKIKTTLSFIWINITQITQFLN